MSRRIVARKQASSDIGHCGGDPCGFCARRASDLTDLVIGGIHRLDSVVTKRFRGIRVSTDTVFSLKPLFSSKKLTYLGTDDAAAE
jgi:hypothetical protein